MRFSLKKHSTLFLFLLLAPAASKAEHRVLDSISHYYKNNKGILFGGFHNRNSFLGPVPVKVYGLRAGLEYGERVSISLGYYTTYDVVDRYRIEERSPQVFDTTVRATNLSYLSIGGEYVFHKNKRWTFGIPVMIGLGTGHRKTYINKQFRSDTRIVVLPIESGVRAHYSITDWFGAEGSFGLRLSPFNAYEFTGFYHSIGLNVYFGALYRKVFKREKE